MQMIKLPFGFKSFQIGNIVIFTGKIRIKSRKEDLMLKLQNYSEHLSFNESISKKNGFTCYTTITFSVTDYALNKRLISAIRNVMCEIAHKRIDAKYADHSLKFQMEDIDCILPF